jgi:hypothetical protein
VQLARTISKEDRMSIGMEGGKKQIVLISCINQLRNNKIMTHDTKFTCATSEKCGTRPRALERIDQGPTRAGHDAVSCIL